MPNSNRSVSYPSHTRDKKAKKFGRRRIIFSKNQIGRFDPFYANDTTAYVPEQWAQESIRTLVESMVFASTVHRDFEPIVASFGETVHTRKPGEFKGRRKQNDLDNVTTQDATASKIEVKLDQRIYVSFVIGDGEKSKAFMDLFNIYLKPAIEANARTVDRALACEAYQFLGNTAGGLGTLTSSNGHDFLLDSREVLNDLKVSEANRWMALASRSETEMQKSDLFKSAERVGDGGTALENAILGRKAGWNNFLELNTPSVKNAVKTAATGTLNAAASAGDTTIVLSTGDVAATGVAIGSYITVAGDMTPLRVTAISTETLTLSRALRENVAAAAVVTVFATGLVNQSAAIPAGDTTASVTDGYPSGWMKEVTIDAGTPKVGQLVSFVMADTTTLHAPEYGIIEVDGNDVWLDRALEDTIDDNAVMCLGPSGDYNFGYQREAMALVNRPLAMPEAGTGARAASATFAQTSLRVVMTYDGVAQGTRVTIDGLFGKKQLDANRGVVLLG